MNRIDLGGRIASVTGAARGIGRAIAERFSTSGAMVAIWDVDGAAAATTSLAVENATYDIVDVTDPAGIARALEATEARLGPPDILVNNAGISGPNPERPGSGASPRAMEGRHQAALGRAEPHPPHARSSGPGSRPHRGTSYARLSPRLMAPFYTRNSIKFSLTPTGARISLD